MTKIPKGVLCNYFVLHTHGMRLYDEMNHTVFQSKSVGTPAFLSQSEFLGYLSKVNFNRTVFFV